ncbi:MAG: ADP-ribosylglycohydrolase family protein, partial [Anaerolineae bacterium]
DGTHVLAETGYDWSLYQSYELEMTLRGREIVAAVNGEPLFRMEDDEEPGRLLDGGAVALLVDDGRAGCADVQVSPVDMA